MNFERYKIDEGEIIIAYSDENVSVGYLENDPGKELKKHNRPCTECLYQVEGVATVVLFDDNDRSKEVVLKKGDQIEIPPEKWHIHSNRSLEKSVTMWKAKGNIIEILDNIRNSSNISE